MPFLRFLDTSVNPLHDAAFNGDLEKLHEILGKEDLTADNIRETFDVSAMSISMSDGQLNVNTAWEVANGCMTTALEIAVERGHLNIVEAILGQCAVSNIDDNNNATPQRDSRKQQELLLAGDLRSRQCLLDCASEHPEIVRFLLPKFKTIVDDYFKNQSTLSIKEKAQVGLIAYSLANYYFEREVSGYTDECFKVAEHIRKELKAHSDEQTILKWHQAKYLWHTRREKDKEQRLNETIALLKQVLQGYANMPDSAFYAAMAIYDVIKFSLFLPGRGSEIRDELFTVLELDFSEKEQCFKVLAGVVLSEIVSLPLLQRKFLNDFFITKLKFPKSSVGILVNINQEADKVNKVVKQFNMLSSDCNYSFRNKEKGWVEKFFTLLRYAYTQQETIYVKNINGYVEGMASFYKFKQTETQYQDMITRYTELIKYLIFLQDIHSIFTVRIFLQSFRQHLSKNQKNQNYMYYLRQIIFLQLQCEVFTNTDKALSALIYDYLRALMPRTSNLQNGFAIAIEQTPDKAFLPQQLLQILQWLKEFNIEDPSLSSKLYLCLSTLLSAEGKDCIDYIKKWHEVSLTITQDPEDRKFSVAVSLCNLLIAARTRKIEFNFTEQQKYITEAIAFLKAEKHPQQLTMYNAIQQEVDAYCQYAIQQCDKTNFYKQIYFNFSRLQILFSKNISIAIQNTKKQIANDIFTCLDAAMTSSESPVEKMKLLNNCWNDFVELKQLPNAVRLLQYYSQLLSLESNLSEPNVMVQKIMLVQKEITNETKKYIVHLLDITIKTGNLTKESCNKLFDLFSYLRLDEFEAIEKVIQLKLALADIFFQQQDFEKAASLYEDVIALIDDNDLELTNFHTHIEHLKQIYWQFAETHEKENYLIAALGYYDDFSELAVSENERTVVILKKMMLLEKLAAHAMDTRHYQNAITFYRQALRQFEELSSLVETEKLSQLHQGLENAEKLQQAEQQKFLSNAALMTAPITEKGPEEAVENSQTPPQLNRVAARVRMTKQNNNNNNATTTIDKLPTFWRSGMKMGNELCGPYVSKDQSNIRTIFDSESKSICELKASNLSRYQSFEDTILQAHAGPHSLKYLKNLGIWEAHKRGARCARVFGELKQDATGSYIVFDRYDPIGFHRGMK